MTIFTVKIRSDFRSFGNFGSLILKICKKYLFLGVLCLCIMLLSGCGSGPVKADARLKQKHYQEAVQLYQKYLAEKPDSVGARTSLGFAYLKAGRPDEAVDELAKVLSTNPDQPDPILYMGLAYVNKGMIDKAMNVLQRYRNENQPLVEEEVRYQLNLLKIYKNRPLNQETLAEIVNRIETAVDMAASAQKKADKMGQFVSENCDCE